MTIPRPKLGRPWEQHVPQTCDLCGLTGSTVRYDPDEALYLCADADACLGRAPWADLADTIVSTRPALPGEVS